MMESPVVELLEAEYRRVWDRFSDEFTFRPSTSSLKWPAIKEPVPSVTWSLAALDDDPEHERLDRLVEVVEQGLTSCIGPDATLLALDWQHTSYRFTPRGVGGPGQPAWPLSPYPDGDYYIYLSEDFRTGSFGHPWEYSLCLFGQEFLDAASTEVERLLGRPIRRSPALPMPRYEEGLIQVESADPARTAAEAEHRTGRDVWRAGRRGACGP